MPYCLCGALGYALGCINPAYLLGRRKGMDIRFNGSGNAGASNAMVLMGKKYGIFVALFDIAKAFLAVTLSRLLFPSFEHLPMIAGTACVLGHIFPAPMRFRGGKGFASMGGVALALSGKISLILLAAVLLVVLVTKYIFLGAITIAVLLPLLWWQLSGDAIGAGILAIASVCMLIRHKENFIKLSRGEELEITSVILKDKYVLPKDRK